MFIFDKFSTSDLTSNLAVKLTRDSHFSKHFGGQRSWVTLGKRPLMGGTLTLFKAEANFDRNFAFTIKLNDSDQSILTKTFDHLNQQLNFTSALSAN